MRYFVLIALFFFLLIPKTYAVNDTLEIKSTWFLHYTWGEDPTPYNKFSISRGYTTLNYTPVDWFSSSITTDTYTADDGLGIRIKFLYGSFIIPLQSALISKPTVDIGVVRTPWFDFERKINKYRILGNYFLDKYKFMSTADTGIHVHTLLGSPLTDITHHNGTFGSAAVGVYNGSGFKDFEENQNKLVMGRATIRPLFFAAPGLQLSYFYLYGKDNSVDERNIELHAAMLSFEYSRGVFMTQFAYGTNDAKYDKKFYGLESFAELKLHEINLSIIGKFGSTNDEQAFTAAIAYYFYKKCAVLVDYSQTFNDTTDPWLARTSLLIDL